MANPLLDKILKNSTIKESAILEDSIYYQKKSLIKTSIPALNVAQSGEVDGGFGSGVTIWAGPSKHFKTGFVLLNIKAYLDKYPDAVCIFYDNEFGTPQSYFKRNGIDPRRVVHCPITNIEDLKFDLVNQLMNINRGDHVFIAIDSLGNLASKKEVEDAKDMKSVADMTRAKAIKSLFRIITPHFAMKDIPCHVVAHTYMTQEMYAKAVVSGGTGQYYAADNIYVIGRQQEKEGTEIAGWNFILTVEKSRFVREKMKVPINVTYEKGVSTWSALLEWALEFGLVTKPKMGWYTRPTVSGDKNWREADTDCAEFWSPLFKDTNFADAIRQKYQLPEGEENPNSNSVEEDIEE
jgi:RecA/RadA recombinase